MLSVQCTGAWLELDALVEKGWKRLVPWRCARDIGQERRRRIGLVVTS